ncbi:hypothetical protein [Bradyrhizobium iriomotense]|uniref:hypothetical protein n=1 Tax=Bradyrhizobium iriomotense TaxID=441950 RepID=UPI001B8A758D|nr:hypothetical protein [Bradyrhizobium iriomotense]MBR1133298.1 hypothetical protein [Bradyrhizobium iriomotense]
MVTSRELADIVGDALGIARESAQLHLKTIRAAGEISFKGYGRAAAKMTPLDAARLVIAALGSTFAKDSVNVLKRFAKLKPIGGRSRSTHELESLLMRYIAILPRPEEIPSHDMFEAVNADYLPSPYEEGEEDAPYRNEVDPSRRRRRSASRRLTEVALQLLEPVGADANKLPCYAIFRSVDEDGSSQVIVCGPDGEESARGTEIPDLVSRYSDHRVFQVRILKRRALVQIAAALKGIEGIEGVYGNG